MGIEKPIRSLNSFPFVISFILLLFMMIPHKIFKVADKNIRPLADL
jgi:hypothetical protein